MKRKIILNLTKWCSLVVFQIFICNSKMQVRTQYKQTTNTEADCSLTNLVES